MGYLSSRAVRMFYGALPRKANQVGGPLALHGGTPVRDSRVPWPTWPIHGNRERIAVLRCLEGGAWWYGPRVRSFEQEFASFQGARFCITCSTGTIALEIAMQVLGIGPGDEVIVPAFTFVATASAVQRMGGKVVFADVDASWCLDPADVEGRITSKTKLIVPVHFAGRVADMDRLHEIADPRGIQIFEDACHAWGSRWRDKGAGTLGIGGAFSFQMHKNLSAGEGGAILTDDEAFADACRSIVNCGRVKDQAWYQHPNLGTNARLTEYQAALLSAQLTRLEDQTQRREHNAAILDEGLAGIDGLVLQPGDQRMSRRSYHLYPMRLVEESFGCSRSSFVKACQAEGLPVTDSVYPDPLYLQPLFANQEGYQSCRSPVTEDLCWNSALWLNHWLLLGSERDMRDAIDIVRKVKRLAHTLHPTT